MARIPGIKAVVCDADDTLWDNEPLFREAERRWAGVLSDYGTLEELSRELYSTEDKNMNDLGYGAKAYMISIIGDILPNPATPLPGVHETLAKLKGSGAYTMILLTKGDLLDQMKKVERSGLGEYFDKVKVTAWKGEKEFLEICTENGVSPSETVSVGNSFKSDIAPMLSIGGWGIHIPSKVLWEHERMEEFGHPRLRKVDQFAEILDYLG